MWAWKTTDPAPFFRIDLVGTSSSASFIGASMVMTRPVVPVLSGRSLVIARAGTTKRSAALVRFPTTVRFEGVGRMIEQITETKPTRVSVYLPADRDITDS